MTKSVVLILSNSGDATSDFLQGELIAAGIPVERFNTDTELHEVGFDYSVASGPTLRWSSTSLTPDDIRAIILRRPKAFTLPEGIDRFHGKHLATEWAEFCEGFLAHIDPNLWINHPSRNFAASHKLEQLTRAQRLGFRVPETIATNAPKNAIQFANKHGEVVVKPIASGYIERDDLSEDSSIYTSLVTKNQFHLFEQIVTCPVLIQERLEKVVDVRLTMVDGQMSAVALKAADEAGRQRLDIRRNIMSDVAYSIVEVPTPVQSAARRLMEYYKLRFAALDLAVVRDDDWVFLEVNPNGQWAWLDIEANAGIASLFTKSLFGTLK